MEGSRRSGALRADFFAFRVPALPFGVLIDWGKGVEAPSSSGDELPAALARDRTFLAKRLHEIAHRPEVLSAVSVASPDLLDALHERADDPGVQAALVRYVSRMASRPTPFGLFAACGTGTIADRTEIALPDPSEWQRHTRLDGDYLDRVVRARASELRPQLTFRPNDSLYLIGERRRYVQSRLDGLERTHHLAEVANSRHLSSALAAAESGAKPAEIADAVAAGGVEPERAGRYVDDLIETQVLLPTLAVTLTGNPPLDRLIADLDSIDDADTVAILSTVRAELAAIDAEGADIHPERHAGVSALLGGLAVPEKRARLLQVDATVPDCGALLARSTVDAVARGVELLRRIAPTPDVGELDRFREAFVERYEEREVPLLEALDDDLGVGYGSGPGSGDPAPLLKGLRRPRREHQMTFDRRERRLAELIHRSWTDRALEIVLDADDIEAMTRDDALPLPAAIGAVASLARTSDGPRVLLLGANGPAGVSLLGRFCHAAPALAAHVRAHLRAEEALAPDAIHTEIVHLPAGVMSNILVRPLLREHELEWLGRSGAPQERRLPASDLVLSVRNDRFVLRSRRLGRRVLPRLTSAHNWGRRSPAVYRFLAAIQSEGNAGAIGWSWAPFDQALFTPRVRWGRLILAPAAWCAGRAELRDLNAPEPLSRWQAVQAWRARRRLPRWICLVEGDNKLAIDLDNALSVETFVRTVRSHDQARLEELFPTPDQLVAEGPDGRRAVELVIPLLNTSATQLPEPRATPPKGGIRRTFPPGSEWTYLKLYTGTATADALLRGKIGPLAHELIASGAADRWFFMRFTDPRFHVRVRLRGDPDALREPVQQMAAGVLEAGLAHDVQLGTYQREIERYGGPEAIAIAERVFHADSDAVIALLSMFERGERGLDERWRIGVLGCDALMRDLGLDDHARAAQARQLQTAFEKEFSADARLRTAVAERVRTESDDVAELLDAGSDSGHPLAPGIAVLGKRSARIATLAAELASLNIAVEPLAVSYVHMWLNRLCRSENRFHEYVTYALLARVLQRRTARERREQFPR